MDKKESFDHQYHHTCLHAALKTRIQCDEESETPMEYVDVDAAQYNLYRGHAMGEGHSDRLLDDYQNRLKDGADLKDCGCLRYKAFLIKEKQYGDKALPLSVRQRLYKSL